MESNYYRKISEEEQIGFFILSVLLYESNISDDFTAIFSRTKFYVHYNEISL